MTTISVTYDCGMVIQSPLPLRDDQTMIGQAQWVDAYVAGADEQHDQTCRTCRVESST